MTASACSENQSPDRPHVSVQQSSGECHSLDSPTKQPGLGVHVELSEDVTLLSLGGTAALQSLKKGGPVELGLVSGQERLKLEALRTCPSCSCDLTAAPCTLEDVLSCAASVFVRSCGLLKATRLALVSRTVSAALSSYLPLLFPDTIYCLWYGGVYLSGGRGAQGYQSIVLACYSVAGNSWKRIALPKTFQARMPRLEALFGKVYLFEGYGYPSEGGHEERILQVEPSTGQCSFLPPLILPRQLPHFVMHRNGMYAVGGDCDGTDIRKAGAVVEGFDPDAFCWNALPTIDVDALSSTYPGFRVPYGMDSQNNVSVHLDGFIYTLFQNNGRVNIYKISPLTGSLCVLPRCPSHKSDEECDNMQKVELFSLGSVLATRGRIYVVGGRLRGTVTNEAGDVKRVTVGKRDVWYFDTQAVEWRIGPVLWVPRASPKLIRYKDNILVFGGVFGRGPPRAVETIALRGMKSQIIARLPFEVVSVASFRSDLFVLGSSGQMATLSDDMRIWICMAGFDHSCLTDDSKACSRAV